MSCNSFSTGFCEDQASAGVASFAGRTGSVVPTDADYSSAQVTDATVGLGATVTASLALLLANFANYATTTALEANRRLLGSVVVIASLSDLDLYAPAIANVRTISQVMVLTTAIVLPAGERMVWTASSVVMGLSSASCSFSGNVDAALVTGAPVAFNVGFANTSVGVSAKVFAITDLTGRTIRIEYCAIGAGAPAGTISNTLGPVTFERLFLNGCAGGFVLDGTVAVFEALACATRGMPAGSIGFDIASACTIVVALAFDGCSFITGSTTDRGIRISNSATLPTAAPPTRLVAVNILGCKIAAITGTAAGLGILYDEGAGSLPRTSGKLVIRGCPNMPDSRYISDVDFEDFTTPIITAYTGPAPTAWIPVAHQNVGPTSVLTALASSARFTLVRNPADPLDWYTRYDGPVDQTANVAWNVTIESNGGGGGGQFIEFRAEVDVGGVGVWAAVEGSNRRIEQRAIANSTSCLTFVVMQPGDRFRLCSRNVDGTGSTKVFQYDLIVSKT